MKPVSETKKMTDVGVIVGRFQVPTLHEAHKDLIRTVCSRHNRVLIILGVSAIKASTRKNALDFDTRRKMIEWEFKSEVASDKLSVYYIKNCKENETWAHKLDTIIDENITIGSTVTLYGSRDSFIKSYSPHGKYECEELIPEVMVSGTEIRHAITRTTKNSPEFRAGAFWAATNRFPTVYTTVDVAVIKKEGEIIKLLLGRKGDESKFRIVGGFADVRSESFEHDAKREVYEETNRMMEISEPKYLGSFNIDDWRYRDEDDKIRTLFFLSNYVFGTPEAADDIKEVKWFVLTKDFDAEANVEYEHVILVKHLVKHLFG